MLRKPGAPEWIFGPLLVILIFLMGFVVGSSPHSSEPTEQKSAEKAYDTTDYYYSYYLIRDWFAKDAAGFFTALLFLIGSGQAALFYVQLRIMRRGLRDAEDAAKAARDAANAGLRQATVAEQQLSATQRPWVKVDKVTANSDLVFENGQGRIDLLFQVSNKGNSPGLKVRVNAKLVASNQINLLTEQRKYSASFRTEPVPHEVRPEITSWPGDIIVFPVRVWLSSVEMLRFKPFADRTPFPVTLLAIVGCITYEFSFAPGHHQTGIIYDLRKSNSYPPGRFDKFEAIPGAVMLMDGFSVGQGDLAITINFVGTGPVD
jgi:hypothetical protein